MAKTTTKPVTKIGKQDFTDKLSTKLGISKLQADKTLNTFLDLIQELLLEGNEVNFTGFGSFTVRERKARTGINPKTLVKLKIAATRTVGFKIGKTLKDKVK